MNRRISIAIFSSAIFLLSIASTRAQEKDSPKMPRPAPTKPFAFPRAATRTLPNGLKVFVVSNSELPAVVVQLVMTSAGSVNDPAGKPGVAAMTADMITQGTIKRSAQQIAEAIDFVGGTLNTSADDDSSGVTLTVVKKDLDTGMDLMADVTRNASFQNEEIERRRQQLLSNLQVQYATASYLANVAFSRILFGNHPYGMPGTGTPQSVKAMDRNDLVRFRDTYYVPNGALLAFAGDISAEAAFAAAEKYFGGWPRKDTAGVAAGAPRFASGVRLTLIDKPDAVQTEIRIGRGGVPRNHPDYIPLYVANRIFGGGYNSRLSTEVRIKKGLTYGAYSGFNSARLGGSFSAATSTRTEATVEATKLMVNLIQQMSTGEATPAEMDFARDYIVGVFPLQSETPGQVAGRVLAIAEFGLPADYYDTYREKVAAMSPAEIKRVASQYFTTGNMDVVLVGNVSAFRDAIKKEFPNAKVEEIAFDQVDLLAADLRKPKEAAGAASPESLARAREILNAAVEASGGAAAIKKITSVAFNGTGEINSPQGTFPAVLRSSAVFPDKVWLELDIQGYIVQTGFDGKVTWQVTPQGPTEMPASMSSQTQRGIDLLAGWGVYRRAIDGDLKASFAGEKDFQGKKTLAVDWESAAGKATLFFDPASHLLVGAAFKSRTPQGEIDTVNIWSEHKAVDGVQFPFHSVTMRDGAKFLEQNVKEVKLNVAIEPKQFAKPN